MKMRQPAFGGAIPVSYHEHIFTRYYATVDRIQALPDSTTTNIVDRLPSGLFRTSSQGQVKDLLLERRDRLDRLTSPGLTLP
jgi:hypothetical protein